MSARLARTALRASLAGPSLVLMPGIYDALSALLAEQTGFKGGFLSGSALAFSQLGRPDIGLLTATELITACDRIANRVSMPIFVDADSGFGNAANLHRLIGALERAGASGVQIEDQEPFKPMDALASRPVISRTAMLGKLAAAQDARSDETMVISARTDAAFTLGVDEALERAALFAEAGADMVFVEGLTTKADMARLTTLIAGKCAVLHNVLSRGASPFVSAYELETLGYRVALMPSLAIQAGAAAIQNAFAHAVAEGLEAATDRNDALGFVMPATIETAEFMRNMRAF